MRWILATHRGTPLAIVAVLLAGSLLAVPPPAAACPVLNPLCWIEEGVDFFTDLAEDLGHLAGDVFTLDLEGAYHDFVDIAENFFCGRILVLDFIGAGIAEELYNNSCAAPHTIAPEVLEKLHPYFESSFTSVVIHEDCDFSNRNAITFGEHCVFHGFLPPNPWEGCHSIHGKPATQSTGNLPLNPRQGCHPLQGKPAAVGAQRRWVAYY